MESLINDWYWDKKSHEFARQVGLFLLQFIDSLEEAGLSEKTISKHIDNCWSIGWLECGYGYHKSFSPPIFLVGPSYEYEFQRKVSDSKYAVDSYKGTWRKLKKYIISLGYDEKEDKGHRSKGV